VTPRWDGVASENCYRENATTHDLRLYNPAVDELPLICLSGECSFGGDGQLTVNAVAGAFPTVGVRGVFITSGKWYYEVRDCPHVPCCMRACHLPHVYQVKILDSICADDGIAQIGWCAL
jgi:hypothetical protein